MWSAALIFGLGITWIFLWPVVVGPLNGGSTSIALLITIPFLVIYSAISIKFGSRSEHGSITESASALTVSIAIYIVFAVATFIAGFIFSCTSLGYCLGLG